jgi:hypothetical protein
MYAIHIQVCSKIQLTYNLIQILYITSNNEYNTFNTQLWTPYA